MCHCGLLWMMQIVDPMHAWLFCPRGHFWTPIYQHIDDGDDDGGDDGDDDGGDDGDDDGGDDGDDDGGDDSDVPQDDNWGDSLRNYIDVFDWMRGTWYLMEKWFGRFGEQLEMALTWQGAWYTAGVWELWKIIWKICPSELLCTSDERAGGEKSRRRRNAACAAAEQELLLLQQNISKKSTFFLHLGDLISVQGAEQNWKNMFSSTKDWLKLFFCDKASLVKTWMLIKEMTMKIMLRRHLRPWKQAKSGHCHVPPLSLMPVRTSALYRCTVL